jgi:hypothetical protein
MEAGVSYNKQRLHKTGYFRELLPTNPDITAMINPGNLQRAEIDLIFRKADDSLKSAQIKVSMQF